MRSWPVVPLGEAAEIAAGITLGRKTAETELIQVPYLRVANVQDGRLDLSDVKLVAATRREIAKWELKDGDLLLTEGGDPDKLGRGTCWRLQLPLCIHQNHIFRLRFSADRYDPDFVSYQIGSPYGKSYFLANAKKTTGIATINQRVLAAFPLLSPPLPTQQSLVNRLKARLEVVGVAQQALYTQVLDSDALLASVFRARFNGIVPIGVPPSLPRTAPGWNWRKLSAVARLESGHTPSRSRPDWWDGDVSWISLTEIRAFDGQWVDKTQLRTNDAGIANSAARILPRGTVCFSRTASVGFVAIMAQPMATSQDFANWVCSDELDPEYLMYALIASRKELRELATGATHKTIYMPTLEAFHVCAPALKEQRRVVAALKDQLVEVEKLQSGLKNQTSSLSALPQRILAEAFEM